MTEVFLITGNKNKQLEFEKLMSNELKVQYVDIDLTEIQSDDIVQISENKAKSAYNMLIKKNVCTDGKMLVITDDTGLYLNCLNLFPGPYIKWMQKSLGSHGIANIVSRLQDDGCHAICVYSVYDGVNVRSFKGITQGRIAVPRGPDNFGWDNIFSPEDCQKTFSEMSFEEKQSFSPRYKAFVQLKDFLREELATQTA
ncbi:Ham1-like protein, putative [Plasmodium ovale curtisi]|uniref:Ham1-like protein, putative n=1 Tax=Plasmodium ovale curtisi TaxID=864141 RepID=A0A1A8WI28_PLAOA|nr:Ham1-like protein, putative [Plasmodium ovale curtisi]